MRLLVKILGGIVAALVLLVIVVLIAARFSDGPLAVLPGGPLASGEIVSAPIPDWSFAEAVGEIEMQLADDDTSRTTWILVTEGRAFIPCSLGFPPGKTWHHRAVEDGRAVVRILGKRYPVTLRRTAGDSKLESELKSIVASKYGGPPTSDAGVWFFAIESRAASTDGST